MSHDLAGGETVEVLQVDVVDSVNTPTFLVVQTIVEVCQIRFPQSLIENLGVRQRRNPSVQLVQKTDEVSPLQSVGTPRLFAERNIPNGRKDPEDDRSPSRVEHHAGRECHRSYLVERIAAMPHLTREDR